MATSLIIRYPKNAIFDFEYYVQEHLSKAISCLKPAGMESYVIKPDTADSPHGVIFESQWPSVDTCQTTVPKVVLECLDDVKNYSFHDPKIFIMEGDVAVTKIEIQRKDLRENGTVHCFSVKEKVV